MLYLSLVLPLVISLPQLFFPPQVEQFYLGRLSKGGHFYNMTATFMSVIFPLSVKKNRLYYSAFGLFQLILFTIFLCLIYLILPVKLSELCQKFTKFPGRQASSPASSSSSSSSEALLYPPSGQRCKVSPHWSMLLNSLSDWSIPTGQKLRGQAVLHTRDSLWTG